MNCLFLYKKSLFLVAIVCSISFINCKHKTPKIKEVKQGLPAVLFKIQSSFNDSDSTGYENLVLRLYEDGTYSHFAVNFYNFGTWLWDEQAKQLTLTPSMGSPFVQVQKFDIKQTTPNNFVIKKLIMQNNKLLIEKREHLLFTATNKSLKDPFEQKAHKWRVKPLQQETKEQIKNRTLQYLYFLKQLHQYASDNNIELLPIGWYPTPIQMHFSNGARMAYAEELKDWYACFYSEEQGIDAYKLMSGNISKCKLKEYNTRAERNIDLTNQLINLIEKQ